MKKLRIDVWSDIACPWCYVGKRRLESAITQFVHADSVEVVWRAFELDPSAPRVLQGEISYAERLARKYRSSVAEAETMIRRMTEVAAEDGLDFRFDRIRPGNTFDAHRLLHFAADHGAQNALKERMLRAYMTDGEAIGDTGVLARLAGEVGLDVDEVQGVLTTDAFAREVREDESQAAELGITGVPFFVLGRRYGVSGAQPAALLLGAIERAWAEIAIEPTPSFATGATCGPEGCE